MVCFYFTGLAKKSYFILFFYSKSLFKALQIISLIQQPGFARPRLIHHQPSMICLNQLSRIAFSLKCL